MAKPIGNGNSKEINGKSNAALDRSWLVNFDDDDFFSKIREMKITTKQVDL